MRTNLTHADLKRYKGMFDIAQMNFLKKEQGETTAMKDINNIPVIMTLNDHLKTVRLIRRLSMNVKGRWGSCRLMVRQPGNRY